MTTSGIELNELIKRLQTLERHSRELTGVSLDKLSTLRSAMLQSHEAKQYLHYLVDGHHHIMTMRSAILDALPVHVALLDADGQVIEVNQAWRRFARTKTFGGERPGIGESYLKLCEIADGSCSDEAISVSKGIRSVIEGACSEFSLEYPCQKHWFRVMATALQERMGAVVMHVDITECRAGAEALRASEAQLRAILDHEPECVRVVALDGRLLDMNRAGLNMVGASEPLDVIGRPVFELIHPDDREAFAALHQQVIAGKSGTLQYRVVSLKDTEVWMETNSAPLRDTDGSIVSVLSVSRDITERKRLHAQLVESEERFRLLARGTVDAVWDWNLVNDSVWWNDGFQSLFGYALDKLEADSQSWTSRIHPEDVDRVLDSIYRVIHGYRNDWEGKYRFLRNNGTYAFVVDRGFVIRDEQGKATRMVGGMTDITERVSLEEQLRQAQRLEAVGQLTGGIAHDFNNLLTVILGSAELLVENISGDQRSIGLAKMIISAAEHGSELTQRLLAFARQQALDPRAINVNELVAGMDGLLRRTLGEHIEVELIRGAGLWSALIDKAQLESALLNLCINARDAMQAGGKLTIETANARLDMEYASQHVDLKPGQYVMLAVSDTGVGIASDHLPRVFEPFFTTKEKGKGTGLGLAMVYGFIKQSGGHVKIYSELGQGTTVRLYLPRVIGTSDRTLTAPMVPREVRGIGETILVVEDDVAVRALAHQQLIALGYNVITSENGLMAMDILRSNVHIDLLFTDVVMPGGMSGRQLADAAVALRPSLKVLFTSGYTENAIVHHGRLDPGVCLLAKPYRKTELARMIRVALENP